MRNWKAGKKSAVLFSILLCYFYFRGIGDHGLIDPVEGVNASIALQMAAFGGYFVPKIGDSLATGSTLGTWWLQALSLKIFGWSEFAVRFISALSGLLMILAASVSARSDPDDNPRRSWLAACVCASMTLCFVVSQIASSHALFSCLTSLAMAGIIKSREDKTWLTISHFLIAFAFIAHGPAGLFVPFISVFAYCVLSEDFELLKDFFTWPGGIIFDVIISGLYFLILIFMNPNVIHFMRCQNYIYDFGGLLGVIIFVFVSFAPFYGFLIKAIFEVLPRKYPAEKSPEVFMLIWAFTFALYSLLSGDVLLLAAIVPALSAVLGGRLDFWFSEKFLSVRYAVMFNILIMIPFFFFAFPFVMNHVPVIRASLLSLIPYVLVLGVFVFACWYYTKTRQIKKWVRNVSAVALLCLMPIAGVFNLTAENYSMRDVGLKLRDVIKGGDVIIQYGVNFPSVYFYSLRNSYLVNCELTRGVAEKNLKGQAEIIESLWNRKERTFLIIPTSNMTDGVLPKNISHIIESNEILLLSNQ